MTLASDLAHEVCPTAGNSGIAHDPSLPLVLGDVNAGKYVVMTYDASAAKWLAQVVTTGGVSTLYSFDTVGNIAINGVPLSSNPALVALVQQAKDAAAAAATSATNAASSADTANTRAVAAGSSATQAGNSATAALNAASSPSPLPDGSDSCATSVTKANQIAQSTRDLVIGGDVTADETFAAGYCDTERQVKATGLVTITIPPNIFSSASQLQRWAAYRLCNATGSIKIVPQAGAPTSTTPLIVGNSPRTLYRHSNSGGGPFTTTATITIPAIPSGSTGSKLVAIYAQATKDLTVTQTATVSGGSLTWTTLRAITAAGVGQIAPDWAVFTADITGAAAGDIAVSVVGNNNSHSSFLQLFAIQDPGDAGTVAVSPNPNVAASAATATLSSLAAQGLVIGCGLQIETAANSSFANWSSNMSLIASGNTNGAPDTAAGNTDRTKNYQWGVASGVQNVTGAFAATANYIAGTGKISTCIVGFAPKTGVGVSVVLEKEGGRDTMVTPYGKVELWFQPDGKTVRMYSTAG